MPPTHTTERLSAADNIGSIRFKESSLPATPPTGYVQNYADTSGIPHWVSDTGLDVALNNIRIVDAVTNAVTDVFTIGHNTSGTPANGLGTGMRFTGESSTTEDTLMGRVRSKYDDITHATRKTSIVISSIYNGTEVSRMTLGQDDIVYIGSNGATPGTITLLGGSSGNEGGQLGMNGASGNVDITFDRSSQDIRFFRNDATATASNFSLTQVGAGSAFNICLGVSAPGTSAQNVLAVANSTAPSTSPTNTIQIFSVDVAGSHEARVRDEAGNVTTFSPHNPQMVDASGRVTDFVLKMHNPFTLADIELDVFGALLALETLTGQTFIHIAELPKERQETWESNETWRAQTREAEIEAWDAQQAAFEAFEGLPDAEKGDAEAVRPPKGPRPLPYESREEPPQLAAQRELLSEVLRRSS